MAGTIQKAGEKQIRNYTGSKLQTRAETDEYVIEGYFIVFDQETELWTGVFEKISRNALDGELNKDVRALINHDTSLVLGRTTAGTLKLKTDDHGLFGTIKVNPKDMDAVNLYERVKRGDVSQCSFGFTIEKESTEYREDGSAVITIEDLNLFEVSVCTFPAYEQTGVQAREKDFKSKAIKRWKAEMKERLS